MNKHCQTVAAARAGDAVIAAEDFRPLGGQYKYRAGPWCANSIVYDKQGAVMRSPAVLAEMDDLMISGAPALDYQAPKNNRIAVRGRGVGPVINQIEFAV